MLALTALKTCSHSEAVT